MTTEERDRLTKVEERSKSNQHRIDQLEKDNEALTDMASSLKLLAYQQSEVKDKVENIDTKVTALEKEPARKYDKLIWLIIGAIVSGLGGYIIGIILK